jgi:hypothetical protein
MFHSFNTALMWNICVLRLNIKVTNKVLSGRGSRDSIIEIILLVSFTKEGSCSVSGLIKSTKVDKGAVTASMPATIGHPGGFVTFLCNFGKYRKWQF